MTAPAAAKRRRKPATVASLPFPQFPAGHVLTFDEQEVVRSFGLALKALRTEVDLTREALAATLSDLLGMPVLVGVVVGWEEGRNLPPVRVAMKFDQALGLPVGSYRARAGSVHKAREKLIVDGLKAAAMTREALAEDGRPPRARRRKSKKTAG